MQEQKIETQVGWIPLRKNSRIVIIPLGYKTERVWQRFILRKLKRGDILVTVKRYINGKPVERQDLKSFIIQGATFDRIMRDVNNRLGAVQEPKGDWIERLREIKASLQEQGIEWKAEAK